MKNNLSGSVQDRRTERTQRRLREALHSLIGEKPYESIAVQEIIDRADVGRSTFYTHFSDKDDLLSSSMHDIVRSARSTAPPRSGRWYERMLWFSLPVFEYHYQRRHKDETKMGARGRAILHQHLQHALSEMIADTIHAELRNAGKGKKRLISADLAVQYVASTFVLVFTWWQQSKRRLPPEEINARFHALVLPTLAAMG